MSLIELLNPDFMKELLESFETIANALQNIARAGFDDSSRLRVRAEFLDDGYIRVRDTSASIDILEMLKEFSWTFYNLAESNKLLSDLTGALSSVGADKLRTSVVDVLPESPFNLTKIGGTALTGRDWSADFAKLQNLDVLLSTRASESTLSGIKSQTDKLTFDASNYLQVNVKATVNPSNLDVALSTRASESTLSGLSGKFPSAIALADNLANPTTTIIGAANLGFDGTYWRRIATDTSGRMKVALDSIPNPSNLDVALSTRASEATLSAIKNALASVGTDKIRASIVDSLPAGTNKIGSVDVASIPNPSNLDVALSTRASESTLSGLSGKFPSAVALGDSLSNPTTTIVGDALLGFDGTYWRRVRVDTSGRLAIQNEPNLDVALSTRASESTLSSFVGTPDSSPPPKGVMLLGYDGTYARRIKTDGAGELQVDVLTVPNPPNLDVSLSSRLSEDTFKERTLGVFGQDRFRYYPVHRVASSLPDAVSVTETSWTSKGTVGWAMRFHHIDVTWNFVVINAWVAAGSTMHVRVINEVTGRVVWEATITSTDPNNWLGAFDVYCKWWNIWGVSYRVEAYVEAAGQTGYLKNFAIDVHGIPNMPRVDSEGYLLIKSV